MNKIEKRELKNELQYNGTTILTYNIEYPEIVYSKYKFGKDIFNRYNLEKAKKLENFIITNLFKEAKELYNYNTSNGYPIMVYEIISEYKVTYNNEYIISLYEDEYRFTGGAHGLTVRKSQNWNLQNGMQLKLSYFYPNNDYYAINILKNINKQIKKQIESGNNIYFDNYCELVLDTFNLDSYFLTSNSIDIFFQQYDISPYSSGIRVFYVPY